MASLQHIKKRLTGVKSINQMTKAMELVAATKMRKSQEVALASRPYAIAALEMLASIAEHMTTIETGDTAAMAHMDLLQRRGGGKTLILVIASDKGLAGSFNSSVFKKLEIRLSEMTEEEKGSLLFAAVGAKAVEYLRRRNMPIAGEFTKFADIVRLEETEPIAKFLLEGYAAKKWDAVVAYSTHFYSAMKFEVLRRQILPVDFHKIRHSVEEIVPDRGRFANLRTHISAGRAKRPADYIVEPDPKTAMQAMIPLLFRMSFYHLMLEANASEHSARRMAMKSANDNAGDLIEDLTLSYNRSRQEQITKEIIEVTGTTSALKK